MSAFTPFNLKFTLQSQTQFEGQPYLLFIIILIKNSNKIWTLKLFYFRISVMQEWFTVDYYVPSTILASVVAL